MRYTRYTNEYINSLKGKKFGLNKIIFVPKGASGCQAKVKVKCLRCGNIHWSQISSLVTGHAQQCPDCQARKYEMKYSPKLTPKLYLTWRKYKNKFYDPWKYDWASFQSYFLKKYKWDETKFTYTIRRLDLNKPFSPDNVKVLPRNK